MSQLTMKLSTCGSIGMPATLRGVVWGLEQEATGLKQDCCFVCHTIYSSLVPVQQHWSVSVQRGQLWRCTGWFFWGPGLGLGDEIRISVLSVNKRRRERAKPGCGGELGDNNPLKNPTTTKPKSLCMETAAPSSRWVSRVAEALARGPSPLPHRSPPRWSPNLDSVWPCAHTTSS